MQKDIGDLANRLSSGLSALSINPPASSSTTQPPNDPMSVLNSAQIRAIIRQEISRQSNPQNENHEIDERIENVDNNLSGMDKIPDVVKSLRDFSGEPGQFASWKKSVDRILKIYEPLRGSTKYYGILSVIRNKIVGCANIALESYNTPLNWPRISKCLTMHYADRRDVGTLEYQLTTLVQNSSSITEFYQQVYKHLSLIMDKLACMDLSNETLSVMTQSYRQKALDTFIRGLRGDLPRLLSMKEPIDMPQALHLCLKLDNISYRTQHAFNSQTTLKKTTHNFMPNQRHAQPSRVPFYPELACFPRPMPPRHDFQNFNQQNYNSHGYSKPQHFNNSTQRNYNNYPKPQNYNFNQQYYNSYPRPLPPKPLPKAEPMDIDHSLQTRFVNYQNRPNIKPTFNQNFRPYNNTTQPQKRTYDSQQHQIPNKFQRTYFTQTGNEDIENISEENNDGLQDYSQLESEENIESFEEIDPEQLNFLD